MHPYPHHYRVSAAGAIASEVELTAARLPVMLTASPEEFGGPGDRWSPETMLVGAVADCFVLTFRAIAAASHLTWESLTCDVSGTLDRVERDVQFTHFDVSAQLVVPDAVDADRARHLLEKAERLCLITNSLKATVRLDAHVQSKRASDWEARRPATAG